MLVRANLRARGLLQDAVRICQSHKVTMVELLGRTRSRTAWLARRTLYTLLLARFSRSEVAKIVRRWPNAVVPRSVNKPRKRPMM